MIRTARRLGIGAVAALVGVAALPGVATASTTAVTVTTLAGRSLNVGDVIAQGTNVDGVCVFAEDTSITLSGSGSAGTHVDESCVMRLASVTDGTRSAAEIGTPGARPKVWEVEPNASPASTGSVVGDIAGAVVIGEVPGADVLADALAAATGSTAYTATVGQTFYDATGTWVYDDFVVVDYVQRNSDGRISGAVPVAGACQGNPGTITTQEVRACWFRMPYAGPTVLDFSSGGTYRQTVLALYQTDYRKIKERFVVTATGGPIGTCDQGGALPPGWRTFCNIDVS